MKIVKLDIDENSVLAGIDAVALVEQPAIEEDFLYFGKQDFAETYNDYPQAAVDAAKQGIKRNKENGNKCATQVGKVRAQQLANREPVSLDTIRRMRSFLIRQKDNYELQRDRKAYDKCGYISYLLWGGEAALPWAEKKLRQAGEEFEGLDDACQVGYKAIGLKIKNGRKVPNCVPIDNFEETLFEEFLKTEVFDIIDKVDGINVYSTKEEAIAKAKEIGCSGYHEHTLEDGEIAYMPCSQHSEATDKQLETTFDSLGEDKQDALINALDNVGISDTSMTDAGYIEMNEETFYNEVFAAITSSPNKPSTADFGNLAVRYRYTGPQDSRNRDFCARLMKLKKVFRKEDINSLSISATNEEFGIYDIFRYKGSYNCRHYWQEVFYKRENPISNDKQPLAKSNRILDGTTLNRPVIQTKTGRADKESFASVDEQQVLVGPLMTPNKLIPRRDENGDEYFVYFTEDTIKKLAYKAMKDKIIDRVNIEHNSSDRVDAYLVESWLVEDADKDKANNYGFSPKKGQWYGKYKVDDVNIWEDYVKTGLVKGFSVEGMFESMMMSKTKCRKNGECGCGLTQHTGGLCDGSHLKAK